MERLDSGSAPRGALSHLCLGQCEACSAPSHRLAPSRIPHAVGVVVPAVEPRLQGRLSARLRVKFDPAAPDPARPAPNRLRPALLLCDTVTRSAGSRSVDSPHRRALMRGTRSCWQSPASDSSSVPRRPAQPRNPACACASSNEKLPVGRIIWSGACCGCVVLRPYARGRFGALAGRIPSGSDHRLPAPARRREGCGMTYGSSTGSHRAPFARLHAR